MIFSTISSSLSRSSRSRNVINEINRGKALLRNQELFQAPYVNNFNIIDQSEGKLGFLRGYFAAIGANKGSFSNNRLSDFNCTVANPRLRRYFSNEAPKKKNYENFYPKEKKEIPKENEQKSESKGWRFTSQFVLYSFGKRQNKINNT